METRLEGKYLHDLLRSEKKPDGASFDLLLVLDMIDLSIRPWTPFSDSLMPPPEPIQVATESEALLTWKPTLLDSRRGSLHFLRAGARKYRSGRGVQF